jgi:rod shape determining protein RodA
MKFATNLALAKFLSNVNLKVESVKSNLSSLIKNYKNTVIAGIIIIAPLIIIKLLQDETGLAIVFVAFVAVLYREGLSVNFILIGFLAITLMVLALLIEDYYLYTVIGIIALLSFVFIKTK